MPRGELIQTPSYAYRFRKKLDELDAAIQQADFDFATTYSTDWRGDSPADPGLDQSIFFKYWRPFVSAWGRAHAQLRAGKADRAAALGLAYWAERFVDLKRSAGASLGLYTSAPDVVIQGETSEDKTVLIQETNARFWAATNYKPGQKLDMSDRNDRAMSKVWLCFFAKVRDQRDRATALAQGVHRELRAPFVLVVVSPDGAVSHQVFSERGDLDVQYTWLIGQPETYAYAASFDFTRPSTGPLYDHFSPLASRPEGVGTTAAAALAALRDQAKTVAQRSGAGVIGVAVQASGAWHTPTFATIADAAAWLDRVSAYPTAFAYAAYFDKAGPMWPFPTGEAIGQAPSSPSVA